jgi:hypothetical protein
MYEIFTLSPPSNRTRVELKLGYLKRERTRGLGLLIEPEWN